MAVSDRVDASVSLTPGWWLEQLGKKLYDSQSRLNGLWDYYDGNATLPEATPVAKESYRRFTARSRTNWAELIVEAVRDRMTPLGFRTGAAGDDTGDKTARDLWNTNEMDEQFADLMAFVLGMSRGYTMVGAPGPGDDWPVISVEDPRQVVTDHDPARPRVVRAGLKLYRDEAMGDDVVTLLLHRDLTESRSVEMWEARRPVERQKKVFDGGFRASDWQWNIRGEQLKSPVVPIIRFRNINGRGEFERHIDLLDRINTMVLQRIVIAVMQAFRQRALIGELPRTNDKGEPIDYSNLFVADAGALWTVPEGVEMWESAQVDLTPVLSSVKDDLMALAAVTRTPMHMFLPETVQGSAEGASLAREGLVYKTEDRMVRANNGLRRTLSLAFLLAGDEQRAKYTALQTIWAPAERRSLAERASANAQAQDVPWRTRMTDIMGFLPEVVERMEGERLADAVLQQRLAQMAEPPQPQQQSGQQSSGRPAGQASSGQARQ